MPIVGMGVVAGAGTRSNTRDFGAASSLRLKCEPSGALSGCFLGNFCAVDAAIPRPTC